MSYLLLIANRNMAGAPSANQYSGSTGNSAQASVCNTVIPHYLCWSSEHSQQRMCLQVHKHTCRSLLQMFSKISLLLGPTFSAN